MREFARTATALCPIGQTRTAGAGEAPARHLAARPPSLGDRLSVARRTELDSAARALLAAVRSAATTAGPASHAAARADRAVREVSGE
ncbi:hypothetical protein ACFTZK_01685 [Streptomyces decoyicus]|uniref:hypothetical protein n=1 Tax=Streptomyces decoyicus TaxID=249567 RepID=UPI00362A6FC6